MVVIDNKRERLCLVSAEGLARETSLCYGATEHIYRTEAEGLARETNGATEHIYRTETKA